MKKNILKVVALVLLLCTAVSLFAACKDDPKTKAAAEYTYRGYSTALSTNWNSHTWEENSASAIHAYTEPGFVDLSALDTKKGIYQWVYEMATSVKDVTADNKGDLTKYGVTLPAGQSVGDTNANFVFEIKLNPDAKWEDGTVINADTYIYSMKQLLNPKMRNYRANLYISGESALAGALAYYNSGAPIYSNMVPKYGDGDTPDYSYDLAAGIAAGNVYINLTSEGMTLCSYTLKELHTKHGAGTDEDYKALEDAANTYGYTKLTNELLEPAKRLITAALKLFDLGYSDDLFKEALFVNAGEVGAEVDYGTVGLYKVDDYTLHYVCQTAQELNYFLTSCTSTWLVYEKLYESCKKTGGDLITTTYGTSAETYKSYGPYRIASYEADKQMVFVRNENWYGWTKNEDGSLTSTTKFKVDGEYRQQYQTTKIVIDVLTDAAAKQLFLKGELTEWTPSADDLLTYANSKRLYKVDETYTMSFFFNTNVEDLKKLDAKADDNKNSVVLSNHNFRKAMSLAINRAEWVKTTSGYKPAYAILNNLYFYDVYNDPNSSYRSSEEAMQAICNLYGVKYGEHEIYKTLEEAYKSINGYNLTEAKALMKTACDELVAAGLYTAGENIKIRIAWAKGPVDTATQAQCKSIENFLNAALEGSGFGKLTLEPLGSLDDRYGDVSERGNYAIGFGAWGGAAFYPFRNFQVYCDSDQYDINEAKCWDPATEKLTITLPDGRELTKTWKDWSNALIGSGDLANESFKVKLFITATLEEEFLKKYYRIPLAGTTACFLMGYQASYYTETYNIMYDFGGFRLLKYNYTDAEWADYVRSQNGTLKYE